MCGRYFIDEHPAEGLERYLSQAEERAQRYGVTVKTSGEIFPSDIVPVIAPGSRDRTAGAFPMRWGFPHPSRNLQVINARVETAPEKAFFAASTEDRRCLIPASAYFEWKKEDGVKVRYRFTGKSGKLYLGGLYIRSSSERIPSFSILTRDATEELSVIHRRMPLLITEENMEKWLSSENAYRDVITLFDTDVLFEKG